MPSSLESPRHYSVFDKLVNEVRSFFSSPRGRLVLIGLTVLLILLLLLFFFTRRELLSLNRQCLSCHTDMALKQQSKEVHIPFKLTYCTACHTLHGGQEITFVGLLSGSSRISTQPRESAPVKIVTDPDALMRLKCAACHGIDAITNSKHTYAEWQVVMDRMEEKGVDLAPADKNLILDYLRRSEGGNQPVDMKPKRPEWLKEAKLLSDPLADLCFNCHPNISLEQKRKTTMPPFRQGQCNVCHDPHASEEKPLLTNKVPDLCFGCHDGIKLGENGETTADYRKMPVQMPPFRGGQCLNCHYPHGTDTPRLLKKGGAPDLCFSCHDGLKIGPNGETTADYRKYQYQMPPFRGGQCMNCHRPHASPNRRLLKKAVPELCFGCHDTLAIGPKGQTMADYRSKAYQMPPFRQGKCFDCHYHAHGSKYPRLLKQDLKGNRICYMCHADKQQYFEKIAHNRVFREQSWYPEYEVGKGSCLNCHTPHGSDWLGLVQKEIISLCLDCHGPKSPFASIRKPRAFYAHPLGFKYTDPWRGNYMRCSSCHNPMGSPYEKLKRKPKDGLCVSCHYYKDPTYLQLQATGEFRKVRPEEGKANPDGTDDIGPYWWEGGGGSPATVKGSNGASGHRVSGFDGVDERAANGKGNGHSKKRKN